MNIFKFVLVAHWIPKNVKFNEAFIDKLLKFLGLQTIYNWRYCHFERSVAFSLSITQYHNILVLCF